MKRLFYNDFEWFHTELSLGRKIFTILILVILFIYRLPIADIFINFSQLLSVNISPSLIENLKTIDNTNYSLFRNWSIIFVEILIIINRFHLKRMNIDDWFLFILIICGSAYCLNNFFPTGWLSALLLIPMPYIFIKKSNEFGEDTHPFFERILLLLVIIFLVSLIIFRHTYGNSNVRGVLILSINEFPFIVTEEVLFRGALWMIAAKLRISGFVFLLLQSILFWIFHTYYMFQDPIFFWIIIPCGGIVLGYIAWKARSITLSTITHLAINWILYLT
jgi:hypothetical protein